MLGIVCLLLVVRRISSDYHRVFVDGFYCVVYFVFASCVDCEYGFSFFDGFPSVFD